MKLHGSHFHLDVEGMEHIVVACRGHSDDELSTDITSRPVGTRTGGTSAA
jgi:hypothetical protein